MFFVVLSLKNNQQCTVLSLILYLQQYLKEPACPFSRTPCCTPTGLIVLHAFLDPPAHSCTLPPTHLEAL